MLSQAWGTVSWLLAVPGTVRKNGTCLMRKSDDGQECWSRRGQATEDVVIAFEAHRAIMGPGSTGLGAKG